MIIKPYTKSLYLEALQALVKRLPRRHPRYQSIYEELNRSLAGSYGEEVIMSELKKVKLPYNFYVFHDILLYGENLFQLDYLILTPSKAIILEVKNIKGSIEFNANPHQIIRTLPSGEKTTFESPEIQLKEAIYQLSTFFKEHHINLPVIGALVFPFASSNILIPPKTTLLLKNEIRSYLREQEYKSTITNQQLFDLKKLILFHNKSFHPFPLSNYFSIPTADFLKGPECKKCGYIGMKKITRYWMCPKCRFQSKDAHRLALEEYFLVFNDSINNKECRDYLLLQNKYQASRILKGYGLVKQGTFRNATYKKSPLRREDP